MPTPSPAEIFAGNDLPKLRAEAERIGGRLVAYKSVFSLIFTTATTPSVHCVVPGQGRRLTGFLASISTLFLGWWSLHGPVQTVMALVWNLRGGFDATEAICGTASALPGHAPAWVHRLDRFDTTTRLIGFAIVATPFIGLLIYVSLAR